MFTKIIIWLSLPSAPISELKISIGDSLCLSVRIFNNSVGGCVIDFIYDRRTVTKILAKIDQRFDASDVRFDRNDKRFDDIDDQFARMFSYMTDRFDDIDKKLDTKVNKDDLDTLTSAVDGIVSRMEAFDQ